MLARQRRSWQRAKAIRANRSSARARQITGAENGRAPRFGCLSGGDEAATIAGDVTRPLRSARPSALLDRVVQVTDEGPQQPSGADKIAGAEPPGGGATPHARSAPTADRHIADLRLGLRRLLGRRAPQALTRAVRRLWRLIPIGVFVIGAGYFGIQRLAAPGPNLPLGATAAMAFSQGPTILLTVSRMRLGPSPTLDPGLRSVTFFVKMRLRSASDTIESGDALASYCSVVDSNGTTYPSDLKRSSPATGQGLFFLEGTAPRQGWVYSAIPRNVVPVGVDCQLGTEVSSWRLQ